jgi:N-acetylmuramoyl-L-alanine amidase
MQKAQIVRYCPILFGLLVIMAAVQHAWAAPPLLFDDTTAIVALDPGHGGRNQGAEGPTGLLEKTVCLELAQKLAIRLESRLTVRLTRSDDYDVALDQRAANANQTNADLFISLHAGAGFSHATHGLTVFYHQPAASTPGLVPDGSANQGRLQWKQLQDRHAVASRALAIKMQHAIEAMAYGPDCKVQSAPLAVLQGADMPAILIEIGHITHPATEKRFARSQGLDSLVKAIDQGIAQFLAEYRPAGQK